MGAVANQAMRTVWTRAHDWAASCRGGSGRSLHTRLMAPSSPAQVLHLSRGKPLFQALAKRGVPPALTAAPGEGGDSGAKPPCLMLELLESIKVRESPQGAGSASRRACQGQGAPLSGWLHPAAQEVNDCVLNEASTQTYEEGSFRWDAPGRDMAHWARKERARGVGRHSPTPAHV